MGPGRLMPYPPRIWTVDIRTRNGTPAAECRTCGAVREHGTEPGSVRRNVISHLAAHARRDLTPPHLRTCQCGHQGCPWHRPHRGCTGSIRLALTVDAASHSWRLADLCHQCCQATTGTTSVPHAFTPTPEQALGPSPASDTTVLPDEEHLVWDATCPPH